MRAVDTNTWKPFRVGDLFDVLLAKGDIQPKQCEDGETLLVSAGNEDNGVAARISADGDGVSELFSARCITVSMFGRAFWQNESFYAVSHGRVNILQPKQAVSDMTGLFLVAALNVATGDDFNYQTMCTRARLIDISVMLPATSDGEPDWAYMEQYMRDVMAREEMFAEHLASLTAEAVADGHVVNTSTWKAFRVIGKNGLFSAYSRGQVAVVRNLVDGEIPYVGAVFPDRDNAITRYVEPNKPSQVSPGNSIACVCDGAAIGTQTYQADDFVGTTNLKILHSDDLNEYRALFLVTALNAACEQRGYSYFDKRNDEAFCAEEVMLPATPDGDPDWAFMEAYMKSVMEREAMFADELDKLVM